MKPQTRRVEPRKRALIVAIAAYRPRDGYSPLHSDNDVPLVRRALLRQGFDSAQVRVLADADATRDGILDALDSLAARSSPGDILVVHYSGHGHRITDDDGDELDGYDEMLVPHGAPAIVAGRRGDVQTYGGEKHIRDDELAARLAALRRSVTPGGNVLVLIDACFSGTGTRARFELPVRGMREPIGPPAAGTSTRRGNASETGSGLSELGRPAGTRSGEATSLDDLATYVVITATSADEYDQETYGPNGQEVGPLSLAVGTTLPDIDDITYRGWFDRIKKAMAVVPNQTPQIEGNVDTPVFSGQTVDQHPYVAVAEIIGPDTLLLAGGRLAGLLRGTRVAFYPPGTTQPTPDLRMARGTVVEAYMTRARVALATPQRPQVAVDLSDAWAFVTEFGLGDRELRIALSPSLPATLQTRVQAALRSIEAVQVVSSAPHLLLTDSASLVPLKSAADNRTLLRPLDPASDDFSSSLRESVLAYERFRLLRDIDLPNSGFAVDLELLPAKWSEAIDWCEAWDPEEPGAPAPSGGYWQLHPGQYYFLRVHNESGEPIFVTILSFMPDATLAQLVPDPAYRPGSIPPGTSRTLGTCFQTTAEYGTEMLKLFGMRNQVDFWPIIESQGRATDRGTETPLERILAESYQGTRSSNVGPRAGSGATAAVMIKVVRRNADESTQ